MSTDNRPLSPHLDIYRWRITMLASTLHRISGAFISLGMFFLVIKLVLLASNGPFEFAPPGMLANAFWFIWSAAVYYHLCNGIRHLVWDAGYGFEVATAEKTARMVIAASLVLTILTWVVVSL